MKRTKRSQALKAATSKNGQPIRTQVARLRERVVNLEKAFDANTGAFTDALYFAEAMLWINRAVVHDLCNDKVHTIEADGEKQIDVPHYLKCYEEHLKTQGQPGEKPKVALDVDPNGAIVFGGTF